MEKDGIEIIKASGKRDRFDPEKLKRSLHRAGASKQKQEEITEQIMRELHDGMTTQTIYQRAFRLLKKHSRSKAARYKLKNALLELGPTGYPFEKLVGAVLQQQGYRVQVGKIVEGYCVQHEVDVVADNGKHRYMVECKFHNRQAHNCDVKIPLYIHSRFNDIARRWKNNPEHDGKFHQGWLVTNTRFTTDAIDYGTCANLKLISWDYPEGGSLKQMIDETGLHPVTCLTSLSNRDKEMLIKQNVVLCRDLAENRQVLERAGIRRIHIPKIMQEARELVES